MTTLPGETGAGGAPASTHDGGPPAVHVRGLVKAYSGVRAVNDIDLDIRRGEIFALLGPNGAGKTTTVEILEGYRTRDGGEVSRARVRPRPAAGPAEEQDRHRAPVDRGRPLPDGRRDDPDVRRLLPRIPRPVDEVIDLVGLEREAELAGEQALRRPAAPPRRGDRPGRRPGAALPRRADHRVRPVGPARGLGSGQEPGRARQDRAADHALHGRGAVPGRPGRGDRRRADRRRGRSPATLGRPGTGPGPDPVPRCRKAPVPRPIWPGAPGADGFTEFSPDDVTAACTGSPGGRSTTRSAWTAWR